MQRVDIVTIFPEALAYLDHSILKRARDRGVLQVVVWDLRDFTTDRHRQVDDTPYGGGAGMVMKPEPFFAAVEAIRAAAPYTTPRIILTSPQGERFTHAVAQKLAAQGHLIILCGHYEGIDERVRRGLATDEISIGDYVLTGGGMAALAVVGGGGGLIPWGVGGATSVGADAFFDGLLDHPHLTPPPAVRAR